MTPAEHPTLSHPPYDSLVARFEARAAERPPAIAVRWADRTLTYAALNQRADAVARELRARGCAPGDRVGLQAGRTGDLIVGALGILKAGAAYVPVDPDTPRARRWHVWAEARVQVVVTDSNAVDEEEWPTAVLLIPSHTPRRTGPPVEARIRPETAAYVMYTSGSTGQPKGVVIGHAQVCGLIDAMHALVAVGPGDTAALAHSYAFDVSVYEIWATLCSGATLWIPTSAELRSPLEWHAALRAAGVTILSQTPTAFRLLLWAESQPEPPPPLTALRAVLLEGERLDFRILADWVRRYGTARPRLYNLLGPTETTVHALAYRIEPTDITESRSLIGTPLPGVYAQVVDDTGNAVGEDVEGELLLAGWGVSAGYEGSPELTASRFAERTFAGDAPRRWYSTGDRVRRLSDGCYEYIGRADAQIKLRGHRIEPGEIEQTLRSCPPVADSVVVFVGAHTERARLVAYIVPRAGAEAPTSEALDAHVRRVLPAVMCPSQYCVVAQLPRTVNGKLDETPLRQMTIEPAVTNSSADPFEHIVDELWAAQTTASPANSATTARRPLPEHIDRQAIAEKLTHRLAVPVTVDDVTDDSRSAALAATLRSRREQTSPLQLFAIQVAQRPSTCAVRDAHGALTYAQLDRRSTALASQLRARGVGPGQRVGLSTARSSAIIVGLLGILKTGAAYVPVDPEYPLARRLAIIEDADIQHVVIDGPVATADYPISVIPHRIPRRAPKTSIVPPAAVAATEPAYVIYTSGSTGRPKGVVVTHANIVGLLTAMQQVIEVGPADVVALAHSYAFDVSVYEIWAALSNGASLWIPTPGVQRTPTEFHAALRRARVSVLCQTPTAFRMLQMAEDQSPPPPRLDRLRAILFGGERLDFRTLAPWVARYGVDQPLLLNLLGATETTVHSTIYRLTAADIDESRSLVGHALPGWCVAVVDDAGTPVAVDTEGDLYVGGWGVSVGYLNRPELTAERFHAFPWDPSGRRWYRTGDRAIPLPDGGLEFKGRADFQVKLRGHRIELGDIEAHLRDVPGVLDAVVLLQESGVTDARLVAFYVADPAHPARLEVIVTALEAGLPEVMRPTLYVPIAAFPLTVNGKLDREALIRAIPTHTATRTGAPSITATLFALVSQLLGAPADPKASFFEQGGHSLLAARLLMDLKRLWGVTLSFTDLLALPSVNALCEHVHRASSAAPTVPVSAGRHAVSTQSLFEREVTRSAHAIAVQDATRTVTYAEAEREANQLAHALIARGAHIGDRVAVSLPRSVDAVIALLAILKCGGVYVPIDPAQPVDRRRALLQDAQPAVWLRRGGEPALADVTAAATIDVGSDAAFLRAQSTTTPSVPADGDRVAYLLYTSGTTGRPNGAELSHHTLMGLIEGTPYAEAPATVLQWAATGFDVSLQEIFTAFAHGARLVIPDEATRRDPEALLAYVRDQQITDLFLPNTPLQWLMTATEESAASLPHLRHVVQAGEPLTVTPALRAFFVRHPQCRLVNHYGPTETHVALTHTLTGDPASWPLKPPIGRPVAGFEATLVDPRSGAPINDTEGELELAGLGVGLGYRGRPEATARKFRSVNGVRRYRTGDRVRRLATGEYVFLGRVDREIKLRGYRASLDDLEAELRQHPQVREAAIRWHAPEGSDPQLLAYVVADKTLVNPSQTLTDYLRRRLAAALVPAHIAALDALPMTVNGKLDERSLPLPGPVMATPLDADNAPQTEAEVSVARAMAALLGVAHIGRRSNFFDVGGNSLGAVRLAAALRRDAHVRITPQDVLNAPTVVELARRLTEAPPLVQQPTTGSAALSNPASASSGPLASAQVGMWVLHQTIADPRAYLVLEGLDLRGRVDVAQLHRALTTLIQRHPVLRTVYRLQNDFPEQRVLETLEPRFTHIDLAAESDASAEERLAATVDAALLTHVDLESGPLVRVMLVSLPGDRHLLAVATHHIAVDGWSISILWADWARLYAVPSAFDAEPPLPRYLDYARERQLEYVDRARSLDYWRRRLENLPLLELPTDRLRPAQASHRGRNRRSRVTGHTLRRIRETLGQLHCTLHSLMMATFQRLLVVYSGQDDFGIGFIGAGRDDSRWHGVVGMYANQFILRTPHRPGSTFADLVARVQADALAAMAHADCTFDEVVAELSPTRSLSRQPLTDVLYAAQDILQPLTSFGDLTAEPYPYPSRTAKMDLLLMVTDQGDAIDLCWEYATDLYEAETIARLDHHYHVLLAGLIAAPHAALETISVLDDVERRRLVESFNPKPAPLPEQPVHRLFEQQAQRTPDAVALSGSGPHYTYRELDEAANQLAHRLIAAGVRRRDAVAVDLPRDTQLIVALMAIWKAGAAYVPFDRRWPLSRQRLVLDDAGIRGYLTRQAVPEALPPGIVLLEWDTLMASRTVTERSAPRVAVAPNDRAYLLYTSGSTGTPKAVETPHRAIVRLLHNPDYVHLDAQTVIPFLSTLSFDAATFELWAPLLHGGRVVVSADTHTDLPTLETLLRTEQVNTMWLTAALFNVVIDEHPALLDSVSELLIGGEALSAHHVRLAYERLPTIRLINGYGPTEVTTFACTHAIPRTGLDSVSNIPIGRPIRHTEALVVDASGHLVPIGVPGELWLGGAGVALGYRGRPELTAERFVGDPLGRDPALRFYRTGDRVRWRADGTLEFLGRLDRQLKIRGHRVEPGEIEAVLARHPSVRQAVVGVALDGGRASTLTACLVPQTGVDPASDWLDRLRADVRTELPSYLIPDEWWVVDELPRTAHGKLDMAALRPSPLAVPSPTTAPTGIALELCTLVSELLDGRAVAPDDDFFVIGGHSLLAVRVLSRLRSRYGVDVSLASFFHDPSVRGLLRHVDKGALPAVREIAVALPGLGEATLALRCVRRARALSRGVCIGVPGALGHAGEISYLAQHILPDYDIYTYSLHTPETLALDGDARSLREPAMFAAVLDALVTAALSPDAPTPTVLFGFSLGGYLAWMLERSLRAHGRPVTPVLNLDGQVLDRVATAHAAEWAELGTRLRTLPQDPPTPMVLVERAEVHRRRVSLHRPSDQWQAETVRLCTLEAPTLDHLEVATSATLAQRNELIEAFFEGRTLPESAPWQPLLTPQTPGGQVYALLAGHQDPALLNALLEGELLPDGMVRLGLLEAALRHGNVDGALRYAQRCRGVEPHERATTNVVIGLSEALGDFDTARALKSGWTYGDPQPVGLQLSPRSRPIPAPPSEEPLTIGYRASLNAACADLRFPVLIALYATADGVAGWCLDPHAPTASMLLDVMDGETWLQTVVADQPIDPRVAPRPDGAHGFALAWPANVPPNRRASLTLRCRADGGEIALDVEAGGA